MEFNKLFIAASKASYGGELVVMIVSRHDR